VFAEGTSCQRRGPAGGSPLQLRTAAKRGRMPDAPTKAKSVNCPLVTEANEGNEAPATLGCLSFLSGNPLRAASTAVMTQRPLIPIRTPHSAEVPDSAFRIPHLVLPAFRTPHSLGCLARIQEDSWNESCSSP